MHHADEKVRRLVSRYTELCSHIGNNEGALIDDGQRYRSRIPSYPLVAV